MKYRREIDGLRALAVLPVILFHAGYATFSGGFVGVDIFFVISGYLITTILINEMEQGSFSIAKFYERRARRILPALFFVILCTIPFAWLWMLPQDFRGFSQSLAAVPLFASNILFFITSNYFDTSSDLKPLLHTWSLAVEEQYYVFFPLVMMFTWKLGKKWLFTIISVLAIFSIIAAEWFVSSNPSFAFYLLPTRAFEILLGALVAFYLNNKPANHNINNQYGQFASVLGLLLIIYSILAFNKHTPSPSLLTLIPVVGTCLVIAFANSKNIVGKILGLKILVGIGLISYHTYDL
jgi:peptidoglycan/LPS O-acetylase OafA/YrhL